VIVRGPLAMGILTGKFTFETRFPEGDFRRSWHEEEEDYESFLADLRVIDQHRELAGGCSLAQLAIQFVLAYPAVSTVIPGAKTVEQLQENVQAGQLPGLTEQDLEIIAGIIPP